MRHDLASEALRHKYVEEVAAGDWDALIIAPPCTTFSRALWADDHGPPRLRSRDFPWGFPHLPPQLAAKLNEANVLIDFACQIVQAAAHCESKRVGVVLEFPEDLGSTPRGCPASLWQILASLDLGDLRRVAVHQCAVSPVDFAKPTGLLTNLSLILADKRCHLGWPTFQSVWTPRAHLPPQAGAAPGR